MPRRSLTLVYIQQSDGIVATTKGSTQEQNGPTKAQLQKTKDSNDLYSYYHALPISHAKSREWREKLGGGLVRDLSALRGLNTLPITDCELSAMTGASQTLTQAHALSVWIYFSRFPRKLPTLRAR